MAHLQGEARARYVQGMFARIAGRYDLMNRLMTGGQDVRWRRYVIRQAHLPPVGRLLDIATGTGEIAWEGLRQHPGIQAVGGDFTIEMMLAGRRDPQRQAIHWLAADTLALPFPDDTFDAVTSGFLMRNVVDMPGAFQEQARVTRPGGRVVVLESSPPKKNLLRPFIRLHLNVVIPTLGRLIAGDGEAYRYLPDSTQQFHDPKSLAEMMRRAGLVDVHYRLFMFGAIAIHAGRKPE
ncbi:MAG: ubiquinone/menaquinone biosynthesis methyltransferase [Chloroflexi bacterium]|nr:ubiquinone/menaquinone biosynthesis methyltransferase [Chloroflexota bacterium]MCI0578374.1 ubiquinone/menaquinone biosynthesis methyltransferase [Chloroflexota bacterium]MCI0645390.1 ubiquinone/menaquinone biosynthesis methyltransferase [Chloroflexota bacterium]MCI0732157.1 ubiquinone/menaquinone biosynthesis methyltransferase [Chloroflexota bacterium]